MTFTEIVEALAVGFEIVGIAIITVGGAYGIGQALATPRDAGSRFIKARAAFARPLLLGLEVLVAADIIETVTIDRSLTSVASLGLLVLIRVILSFSLEAEIDGVWPWRKAELDTPRTPVAGEPGDG